MQTETAAEFLIRKLQQQRESFVNRILQNVSDPEYRRLNGVIQGLDYAIALVKHTAAKVANDEELTDDE